MKKIIVFGGDGFCGWPTSLRLASQGHSVIIVDNLSRRHIDNELSSGSLTNIASITDRIEAARTLCGDIKFELRVGACMISSLPPINFKFFAACSTLRFLLPPLLLASFFY